MKSGHTPPSRKHRTNVIYYSLTDDYDHDEEQTTVTLLYSDEVMDWTPGTEVTEWDPNPPVVNTPWIPYSVGWRPPPPADSPLWLSTKNCRTGEAKQIQKSESETNRSR